MTHSLISIFALVTLALHGCGSSAPIPSPVSFGPAEEQDSRQTTLETTWIEHAEVRMALHCKRLGTTPLAGARSILLLPSATYPTLPNWDLSHPGCSVMESFAQAGWVVFAVDLPGYGESDDPGTPGTFGAQDAAEYVHRAVSEIRSKSGVSKLSLIGWSWGAQVAGVYAASHPDEVDKLVLYGFTHNLRVPAEHLEDQPFRTISKDGAMSDFIEGCSDPELREAYSNAVVAADERAPRGALYDFVKRLPLVDPTALTMPLLVLSGEYEIGLPPGMDRTYAPFFQERREDLEAFCDSAGVELVEIPGGGHIVHLEQPKAWLEAVHSFLDDPPPTGLPQSPGKNR